MKIATLHQSNFDYEHTILAAELINNRECAVLFSSGHVHKWNIEERNWEYITKVTSAFTYQDGGFDLLSKCTIYAMDPIIVIANDYKAHAILKYPGEYRINLWRANDHSEVSKYPIAFFKNETGVPHLVHGIAWNHLQVMSLDTRLVLTADKSVMEEEAEERHIAFYKSHEEDNKLPWPRPFDYFYGELLMSPGGSSFLSKGWSWGSSDCYRVFDLKDFIENKRISSRTVGYWEHNNRCACWIDDTTVAVEYYPFREGDEGATIDTPGELHFYDVSQAHPVATRKFALNKHEENSKALFYSPLFKALVLLNDPAGITIYSLEGDVLKTDPDFKADKFYPETNMFITSHEKGLLIHQLV